MFVGCIGHRGEYSLKWAQHGEEEVSYLVDSLVHEAYWTGPAAKSPAEYKDQYAEEAEKEEEHWDACGEPGEPLLQGSKGTAGHRPGAGHAEEIGIDQAGHGHAQ